MSTEMSEGTRAGGTVIRASLPGVLPDEVQVSVEDGVLTVSGHHEERSDEEAGGYTRHEVRHQSFRRSTTLPEGIGRDDVSVRTEGGVVEITIPTPAG